MGYPKKVYENAWQTLNRRKESVRNQVVARREEIARKLPEVLVVERKMASTAAGITKAVVTDPDRAQELIEQLGRENLALQAEREVLLTEAGYPADYLKEQYHCAQCRDTGYIGPTMCSCLESLLKAEAHVWLGTASASAAGRSTFDNFSLSVYPEDPEEGSTVPPRKRMGEILRFCRDYAEHFTPGSESLLFMGQTGLGKTHMSLAIAHEVTERGYGVLYASTQQLMDRLENEKFSRMPEAKEQYTTNMEIILEADLLILDDLGAEFQTSFTNSALYNIVNTRIVENRPMIISTNLEPAAIEARYSQRMTSRLLCEYRVLKFFGRDVRFIKKIQK